MLAGLPKPFDPIDVLGERIRRGDREVILTGAAGTGKTTVVAKLIAAMPDYRFILTAPTGKAARRLREVTKRTTETVHSCIYEPPDDDGQQLIWLSTKTLGHAGRTVLVVDEASMVDYTLGKDIRSALMPHGEDGPNTILAVGDANQLPPVGDGAPGFDLDAEDAVRLKINYRSGDALNDFAMAILGCHKALDMAKLIRNFQRPNIHRIGDDGVPPAYWRAKTHESGSDATLITWRNVTCGILNLAVREVRGFPADEIVIDDLLGVRTNHQGLGMLNGELYTVAELPNRPSDLPPFILPVVLQDVGDGALRACNLLPNTFGKDTRGFREVCRLESNNWERQYKRGKVFEDPRWGEEARRVRSGELDARGRLLGPVANAVHADFGEAMTAHRAQGSEYDLVGVVFTDWWWPAKGEKSFKDAKAWWYTTATRARKHLLMWIG